MWLEIKASEVKSAVVHFAMDSVADCWPDTKLQCAGNKSVNVCFSTRLKHSLLVLRDESDSLWVTALFMELSQGKGQGKSV